MSEPSERSPTVSAVPVAIPSADDGWRCVHCDHPAWRLRLGSNNLVECDACGALHTAYSVQEARERRDLGRYYDLLFAVARKFPGEQRHETALRYIQEREAAQAMSAGTAKETGND